MQVKRTNYLVNATPTFEVLTEDEIEAMVEPLDAATRERTKNGIWIPLCDEDEPPTFPLLDRQQQSTRRGSTQEVGAPTHKMGDV